MEDKAYGFRYPAVIDFKLGKVTHDPIATPEKIFHHKTRYPPVERLGFQLLGMRVFNKADNSFTHFDKVFGRSLTEENLIHGLALYFQFHQQPQFKAIKETIIKFEEIKQWFEKQRSYHFYASSLIVIYEANLEDIMNNAKVCYVIENKENQFDENNNSFNKNQTTTTNTTLQNCFNLSSCFKIFMADFAHVFPANNTIDRNYLDGLDNLITYLKTLLSSNYKFKDLRTAL
jgi:hypothetical protein